MYLIGLPVFLLITMGIKSERRERKKLKVSEFFSLFLICQALTLLGSIIGSTVTGFIGSIIGREPVSQVTELIENSPLWLIFIVAVVIGPIIEELIFRKLLIDKLARYGDRVAILVSGIAFGLFHGNFEQFFYAAMLGLLFAFVYTKTGKLIHTALLHMAVNFIGSVIAMPVTRAMNRILEYTEGLYQYESMLQYTRDSMVVSSYSVLQYASVAAGVFIAVSALRNKKIQVPDNSKVYLKSSTLTSGIFLNVGVILFLLFALFQFLLSIFFV
jgi:membrane protease YdiL (CAAX protease family)